MKRRGAVCFFGTFGGMWEHKHLVSELWERFRLHQVFHFGLHAAIFTPPSLRPAACLSFLFLCKKEPFEEVKCRLVISLLSIRKDDVSDSEAPTHHSHNEPPADDGNRLLHFCLHCSCNVFHISVLLKRGVMRRSTFI